MTTPPPDTPHAPGFWPSTPDEASSAYHQNEGPLESAGRSLPPASTLGPVLLGAGAGLLVGGPLGALAGGTLGGLGSLEHAGLKSKAQSASNNTAAFEQQQVKQDHALAESPAQKILASTSSTETAGTTAASTLLAGGAGVVTDEAVEHEVAEPAVEPLQPLETSSGLAAEPAADDTVLNMTPITPARTPMEEKDDAEGGLSTTQKTLLGAGAGGVAAGAGFAALRSDDDDAEKILFGNGSNETPAPTLGAPITSPVDKPYPSPALASGPTPSSTYDQGQPTSTLDSTSCDPVAEEKPFDEEEDKHSGLKTAAVAGGVGAGAGAAAYAATRDDLQPSDYQQKTEQLQRELENPSSTQAPQQTTSTTHTTTSTTHTAPSHNDEQSAYAAKNDELKRELEQGHLDREPPTDEQQDGKRKAAEVATGAALGVAGAEGAEEAVKAGGGSKDDIELPKNEDPTASLAAQLGGKGTLPAGSKFYEEISGHQPSRAPLTSRFSDATVDTVATDASTNTTRGNHDPYDNVYADQRAMPTVPHWTQEGNGQVAPPEEDEVHPPAHNRLDPATLVAPIAVSSVPGFHTPGVDEQPSAAFEAFAHLSQAPGTEGVEAPSTPTQQPTTVVGGEDDTKTSRSYLPLAAGGAAAAGAGGLAYAAHERSQAGVGPEPPTTSTLPHSPKHLEKLNAQAGSTRSLQRQLDLSSGQTEPETPSSTRAIKGSPAATFTSRFADPESTNEASELSYPTSDRSVSPAIASAGVHDPSTGQPLEEKSSYDATQQYQQQHGGNPVERSPHMKIAKRKDSIGHNRLHRKSLVVDSAVSPATSAHSGSPRQHGSPSAGEEIWGGAVANVVNDETANRGGHRPALVTIESERQLDHAAYQNGNSSPSSFHNTNSPTIGGGHSRTKSTSSTHSATYSPSSPSKQQQPHTPRKLTRGRRSSSSASNSTPPVVGNPNPAFGVDGFRKDPETGLEKREGFFSKVLHGRKKSVSSGGSGSPRQSLEQ